MEPELTEAQKEKIEEGKLRTFLTKIGYYLSVKIHAVRVRYTTSYESFTEMVKIKNALETYYKDKFCELLEEHMKLNN